MSKESYAPLLAADFDTKFPLTFPVMGSPKLDGIRCIMRDGMPWTRSLKKPVPNKHIQETLSCLPNFDGELLYGDPCAASCCANSQSVVMSASKPELEDGWRYHIFDYASDDFKDEPFESRYMRAKEWLAEIPHLTNNPASVERLVLVEHKTLWSQDEVDEELDRLLKLGHEGLMIRSLSGRYKWGRSTAKEGILIKLKQWEDAEGIITAVHEEMENKNEAKKNALGKQERSSHKANKVGKGILGKYTVRTYMAPDFRFGIDKKNVPGAVAVEFDLGAAANSTREERAAAWETAQERVGKTVTFKYQYTTGVEAPRCPVFKLIREEE
jgi:DNA ligase-1